MKGISMRDLGRSFFRCQSGAVVSAELVVVGTMVVIGLITGLSAVQNSINSELVDISSAFNALDQSYGFSGYESVSRNRRLAWTAPSSWFDADEQVGGPAPQMRGVEPRSEGAVRGGQPAGPAPRGNRGSGGAVGGPGDGRGPGGTDGRGFGGPGGPGGPGAGRGPEGGRGPGDTGGPAGRGAGRGGPDAEADAGDAQSEGVGGEGLQSDELRAAGEWQTTQYAPASGPGVQYPVAPYPGAQYPAAQPQVGYPGPVYYTWQGVAPVYPSDGWQSADSYYSPWFEGYRRYSLGGREMITHVRKQRISEWPLSPWPGQNGWLSSPQEYAEPRARFVRGPGGDAGVPHQVPGGPHVVPGVPAQQVPEMGGPGTPPPPVPDGQFGAGVPMTPPPPVPHGQFKTGGPMTPPPPVPPGAAVRPHRPHPEILQAAHSGARVGRYQVPRQSRLYNAPSWYVAPPNAHEPRFPEYVW